MCLGINGFVLVPATDVSRLDLIIPGEAHFYVKAATAKERQEWLIAFGSCKATNQVSNVSNPPVHMGKPI